MSIIKEVEPKERGREILYMSIKKNNNLETELQKQQRKVKRNTMLNIKLTLGDIKKSQLKTLC